MTTQETKAVKVGDRVLFKSDVEQYSEVKGIMQDPHGPGLLFQVEVTQGDYRHGLTWMNAEKCYKA